MMVMVVVIGIINGSSVMNVFGVGEEGGTGESKEENQQRAVKNFEPEKGARPRRRRGAAPLPLLLLE